MLLQALLAAALCFTASAFTIGANFNYAFFMIFENAPYTKVLADPNFNAFAKGGMLLTNYYTTYHPSQPNYIDLVAGSNLGCTSDSNIDLPTSDTSVVDLLEQANITWKGYMEAFPGNCYTGSSSSTYYRKHDPFMSFLNIQKNSTRCAKIVNAMDPLAGLDADLAAGTLPQYSFYTPDINNDGHNTGITYAGNYLAAFFKDRVFPDGTLIFVTFDEDDYTEGNHLYAVMQGTGSVDVVPGTTQNGAYSHNSYLRTVEVNWNLPSLGRGDATAQPFSFTPTGKQ